MRLCMPSHQLWLWLCLGLLTLFCQAFQIPLVDRLDPPASLHSPAPISAEAAGGKARLRPEGTSWSKSKGTNSTAVVWDRYSLAVGGGSQRIFVFAAEFHPWRLPVPSLWRDVLQRIKAAGFNTVDIYTHWGLIQSSPDPETISLTGVNDLDSFLTVAKEVGLFVIIRPGPYINAETTAGGMAPWTTRLDAILRTNDSAWQDAWKPYIHSIARVVRRHQLTYDASTGGYGGGSVILVQADNEYHSGPTQRAYMRTLVRSLKEWGVTVPITYNDPDRERNFVDLVDLYGLDSYPQRFDCSHPDRWVQLRTDYLDYHESTNPAQPFLVPEFQGGSYDPFGGPGYEACQVMTGADFSKVANHALIAQRATLLSIYMVYGGTNWGGLAEPDVYTSYSYGAAITEARRLTAKYGEYKAQGHFLSSFPDIAMTEVQASGEGHCIIDVRQESTDGSRHSIPPAELWSTELLNPSTQSRFYIVRQHDNTSQRKLRYSLEVDTMGEKRVLGVVGQPGGPGEAGILIDGRDSRIIPVDQRIAPGLLLRFTTANVFFAGRIGDTLAVILYGGAEDTYQWALAATPEARITFEGLKRHGDDGAAAWQLTHALGEGGRSIEGTFRIAPESQRGSTFSTVRTKEGLDILLGIFSTESVARSYAPFVRYAVSQSTSTSDDQNSIFGLSSDRILVSGAYLVRNASYSSTNSELDTLHLFGSMDADQEPPIEVFTLPSVRHVLWNGQEVGWRDIDSVGGHLSLDVPGLSDAAKRCTPPNLAEGEWRYADSLPEASLSTDFDDSAWTRANKTRSSNPYWRDRKVQTQGQVLFASEYGYHGNTIVWRGTVDGRSLPSREVGFEIEVEGGKSFAFSVYFNSVWLGSAEGDREHAAATGRFVLPRRALKRDGANVITVVQDHMGLEMEYGALPIGFDDDDEREELEAVKLPRGILSYSFFDAAADAPRSSGNISTPKVEWKVAGNLDGEAGPDRVRTTFNEGGLYAERQGWHLPGFDDSGWTVRSPTAGLDKAGWIGFFRTEFSLDVPDGHDFSFAVVVPPHAPSKGGEEAREGGRAASEGNYRLQIFVNGWQMGKRISRLGPQTVFPVHSGVLDHHGRNTLGVSLWSLGERDEDRKLEDDIRIVVLQRATGESRDGYVLEAPTWRDLRAGSA
ncbi:uncharacterized protein PFL1_01704 [Pseudozyma flocculosa PF-1]|uniref:uncharacterized protein n=1 Tax=Pseudozyma flocculosa PF-1 TaxID=1277687 RepID=UPI0004560B44|nr:uncharacterized protein PFL1_01704 [Pseudozyma flocculosa PF-1]EPQ30803.1 hypothetical protein PFL1_01704 [Pseudozyma flocculosa PF-1]